MNEQILVSIICITYNHEKYIEDAIKGFLMQKTNFKYEILIHDDASTDNTVNIIKEYEMRYSDLIKAIYQEENQYSKGKPVTSNLYKIARGKYLAFCEGDDYWIDENKLQRQVDFLEKNKEYYAVYHNVLVVDENKKETEEGKKDFPIKKEHEFVGIKNNFFVLPNQMASLVSRNFYKYLLEKNINLDFYKTNGDMKFPVVFLSQGKIKVLEEMMSAYRRTYTGDSWNARIKNKNMSSHYFRSVIELKRLVKDLTGEEIDIRRKLTIIFMESLTILKKNKNKENLKISFDIWRKNPNKMFTIKYIFERIFIKIKEWRKNER